MFLLTGSMGCLGLGQIPPTSVGNSGGGVGDGHVPPGNDSEESPGEPEKPALPEEGPLPPNEAGRVMVLMYHNIDSLEGEWTRTPENFWSDLALLYREGYRLVSLLDYVRGEINLPKGYSPVVLTFDDAPRGQFNLVEENGRLVIDPKSAVGMLVEFDRQHPGFGTAATFYTFYPTPFRQQEHVVTKYRMLLELGMDIGNHSQGHQNLSTLDNTGVQRVLAGHVTDTRKILPEYRVASLALPYGARPKNRDLAVKGEYQGISYHHEAVLLVGSHPAPSPYHSGFNPAAIPRIRASDPYLSQWIEHFRRNPEDRYVSDGDVNVITVPAGREGDLNQEATGSRQVVSYSAR